MFDNKVVRRRRAVLATFVIASIVMLTAYFGESAGGGLHAVQRGVVEVVSPIQEGASRALKPVRDLVGWVGDTIDVWAEAADGNTITGPGTAVSEHRRLRVVDTAEKRRELLARLGDHLQAVSAVSDEQQELAGRVDRLAVPTTRAAAGRPN